MEFPIFTSIPHKAEMTLNSILFHAQDVYRDGIYSIDAQLL